MRTELYWQAKGNHKSNAGGQSVFGELSVAKLLFINQEDLLPNKGSVGQALIFLVSSPELCRTSIITRKATESFFDVPIEKTHRRKYQTVPLVAPHLDRLLGLLWVFQLCTCWESNVPECSLLFGLKAGDMLFYSKICKSCFRVASHNLKVVILFMSSWKTKA